jgi:hypothetical protein
MVKTEEDFFRFFNEDSLHAGFELEVPFLQLPRTRKRAKDGRETQV